MKLHGAEQLHTIILVPFAFVNMLWLSKFASALWWGTTSPEASFGISVMGSFFKKKERCVSRHIVIVVLLTSYR